MTLGVVQLLLLMFCKELIMQSSDLDSLPGRVVVHTFVDVVLEAQCQSGHERGSRSDAVAVKPSA